MSDRLVDRSLIAAYYLIPYAVAKLLSAIGVSAIGWLMGWQVFFEAATGSKNAFSVIALAYILASPLAIIWIFRNSSLKALTLSRAVVLAIGGALVAVTLTAIAVFGPRISALETPSKGIRQLMVIGQYEAGFCAMYASLVMVCIVTWYMTMTIVLKAIRAITQGPERD